MHTISSLVIPELYTAYDVTHGSTNDTSIGEAGLRYVLRVQYECEKCGTGFMVDHKWAGGLFYGGGHFDNYIIFCPNCGHRHENFSRHNFTYNFRNARPDSEECAPRSMTLALHEYKQGFILTIKAKTISLRIRNEDDFRATRYLGTRFEEIRFDLKKRQTTFAVLTGSHRNVIRKYAIGNPFDPAIYEESLLRHIRTDNLSEKGHEGTVAFLKTMRDGFRRKWKEIHGYDIGSLFVSYGTTHGRMLFSMMNFAFRMMYPDAPNLPRELNGSGTDLQVVRQHRMISDEAAARYLHTAAPRENRGSIGTLIDAFALPDKPMVRELLTQDFFAAPELVELFKVTDNLDHAMQIWNLLREMDKKESWESRYLNSRDSYIPKLYPFLQELAKHYPMRSVISLLKRSTARHVLDIKDMTQRLAIERHGDMWNVKLKKLHDWLVEALREQREKGFELHPSDVIKRRLAMQMDSIKFFLPEHVNDLVSASEEMHNCVRTYGERIISGSCNIILMTDDRGKLVACLEVQDDALMQAKLKFNKEVWKDKKINRAVLEWCKKANIKVRTRDVQITNTKEDKTQKVERVA